MIKFNRLFFLLFLFIFFLDKVYSSGDIPASSKGELTFYIDHSIFRNDESKAIIEFNLMLFADQLELLEKNEKKYAVFKIDFKVNGEDAQSKSWIIEASIKDSINIKELAVFDFWNEIFPAGTYNIKVKISDYNGTKEGIANFDLIIPGLNKNIFSSSSIQFVSNVQSAEEKGLIKLNQAITPNPSRRFGVLNPVLYFYYELYNLPGEVGDEFNTEFYITDLDNEVIKKLPGKNFKKESKNISFINGLNVGNLKSGIYNLNIEVSSTKSADEIIFNRQFEIFQAENLVTEKLSEEEIELAGKMINYIATPEQIDFYESLNLPGKTEFIINFWKKLDPTPSTTQNEFLEKIKQRFHYANSNFNWAGIEGWKTDRGRILIQYGMPDEIERHHYESSSLPYEIWSYTSEREIYFVFGDLKADGRFTLLHSNKEGEIYNKYWMEFLSRM